MLYSRKTILDKEYKLMEEILIEGSSTKTGLIKDAEAPELIREAIQDVGDMVADNFDFYFNVLNRAMELAHKRRNPEAGNPSGYYKINAKVIHKELDGYVTFHRGEGLPDLEKDKNINRLIFPEATRMEIEKSQERLYAQSILYDIFTQEEVADVIKDVSQEVINISIESVPTNSIDDYFSVCCNSYDCRPKHTQQTSLEPLNSDKYRLTIRWYDESLMT